MPEANACHEPHWLGRASGQRPLKRTAIILPYQDAHGYRRRRHPKDWSTVPAIFDNLNAESSLGPALQNALGHYDSCDVATGYVDLRGWSSFADIIDEKSGVREPGDAPLLRLLVGMVMPADSAVMLSALQDTVQPPAYGSEVPDLGKARAAKEQLVRHLRNQLMRGLPTSAQQRTLQQLKAQLRSGAVEMRVFTAAPLHGKTYIFHAPGNAFLARRGYVGSSNLTNAGLFRNRELNIDVVDEDASRKLSDWFEKHWDDHFSMKITDEVIELIDESWASEQQPTPYEIYLKVCHALSEDAREGMGYVLPPSMENLLLDYQQTAVRTLARRIVRRGGAMLGDVVGLGKTLTAVATALMLEAAEDYTTLVLCPKNLERMWTEHLDRFGLAGARVVPYSMVDRKLPELKRFHLVICDESHNLRNGSTKSYEAIKDYVRRNSAKVLLLTATPYNLAFADVANQIGLYVDDDEDLGIQPTAAMEIDPALRDKVDGKVTTLAAFRRSEEPEDWKRLMSDHLVRRTRSFIKRTAKKEVVTLADGTEKEREYLEFANGERFHFPERVPLPLSHAFAEDDPARLMESDQTLDAIRDLSLPRYRLAEYDNPKAEHSATDEKVLSDIRSGRGNVSGFVRVGLFKRLSSSGHSFILSLQRQRARNSLFLHAIERGLPVPLGSFTDKQFTISDEDLEDDQEQLGSSESQYDELVRRLPPSTKWLNSGVFKATLAKDLRRDNLIITELLDSFGSWDAAKDSKLNALVDLLRDDYPGEKVLVFTEYADTAEYVANALDGAKVANVGLATGDSEDPAALARRFSPESNRLPGDDDSRTSPDDPIDVLIATDVLSEGQNLQDSHIVVNYDLPWAIIRIIQRAGRVDRIGQKAEEVFIYLITHEKVEQAIQLRQRIRRRLGDNAAAFGSDERFFGDEREVNLLDDLYKGVLPPDDELADDEGEADAVSESWLVWSRVRTDQPELAVKVQRMQDMVHSTRTRYDHEARTGVVTFARTSSGVDAFAASADNPDGDPIDRLLTPLEALRLFRAQETTPTAQARGDHFEREARLMREKLLNEVVAAGSLRGIRKWAVERLGGTIYAADASDAFDAMNERPLTEYSNIRLRQARRGKYSDQDLADLIRQLHDEERLVIGTAEKDEIKLVCSIGVVEP